MRCIPVGEDAVLVEVDDTAQASALYAEARRRGTEAVDIVPAARTVLFRGVPDVAALTGELLGWSLPEGDVASGPLVEVPTRYDGPDLAAVARLWDMTEREAIGTHTATDMLVAFCGFAPGFAYCTGLPAERAVPRLDTPRTRVPAGSVGLAGAFTGVYPTASPGGWQLLGRTGLTLWDASRDQPATLAPGTRVRFVEVHG
ncbi:MAG TPA: allophanate hydrolase subunit 1 [Nocardioidaceae bacterium]|nr:allophanate hydrolase subunit 1 [Nocardioidaceae bacterium]